MLRMWLGAVLVVGLVMNATAADTKDSKDNKDKKQQQATITKVDAKAGTVTVRMKDASGKDETRTFKLAEDVRYFDSTGKAAAMDVFTSGNDVLIVEAEGKLKELRQNGANTANPASTTAATHEGTVVSVGDNTLTVEGKDKKDYTHPVAKDAKITCDGKECKLSDLKKGTKVEVTTEGTGDNAKFTKIEGSTK